MNVNIGEILKRNFRYEEIFKIHDLRKFKNQSYIYYEFDNAYYVFTINKSIQSQLIRKIICEELEINDFWNWSKYPFRENIIDFLNKYPISQRPK